MSDDVKTDDAENQSIDKNYQLDSENNDQQSFSEDDIDTVVGAIDDMVSAKEERRGRPSKYWPELHNGLARAYAMAGLSLDVIAGRLDIALSTLYEWKDKYPLFSEALSAGKQYADDVVEASLFQRATGYDHKAVKIFMPANAEEPVYAPYVEHVPPDVTAAKLWLTNRKPRQWKEKMELDANISTDNMAAKSPEELEEFYNKIRQRNNQNGSDT